MARATAEQIDHGIREAIPSRRLVRLRYHGKPRIVEPHDYGLRDGAARLLVYQRSVAGDPTAPATAGWRDLFVAQIEEIAVLDERFSGSRGSDHVRHIKWDTLFARVT